jgi:hypothetical protein
VSFAGGANAAQLYPGAGMVDEMEISLVPNLHRAHHPAQLIRPRLHKRRNDAPLGV